MTASTTFSKHFETLLLDDRTLQIGYGETIVPESFQAQEKIDVMRTLPRLSTDRNADGDAPDLLFLGTLGEGGMGLVRVARQNALDREVAVKTLRDSSEDAAPKLLQEAYATGRLEHPNIIPIYTLGRDEAGMPLIVMKRVEGVSWLEAMGDPEKVPDGSRVDLIWHLEILLNVCNALRYAHSRGVLHRDIKPENVMIGRFGEVYLLDWGIAISVATPRDSRGVLPHRDDVIGLSGTPAYMAPEMTDNTAERQDKRTDVYLLGAVLHEVLTGEPRHGGNTLFEVMRSSFENKTFQYDEAVPRELAEIATRAMQTEKDDRFCSVEEFRKAVADYLDHRGAYELIEEASSLLDQIDTLAQRGEEAGQLHDLFTACRFACQQALRALPDSEPAQAVYARYLEHLFDESLRRKEVFQAEAALGELEDLDFETAPLQQKLSAMVASLETERAEFEGLRAFADDADIGKGRFTRSIAVAGMGLLWSAHTIYNALRRVSGGLDEGAAYIQGSFAVVAIAVVGVFLGRKALFSNAANRRFAYLLLLIAATTAAFRFIFWINPHDITTVRALETTTYGVFAVVGGLIGDDMRIAALGVTYFFVALVDAKLGAEFGWVLGINHLLFFGAVAWCWTPRQFELRKRV